MPKPTLQTWANGEKITPKIMTDRITTPQSYYGKRPYFVTKGCKSTTQTPRSGAKLRQGGYVDISWVPEKVGRFGFNLSTDGTYLIIPENGIYHLHFQACTYGSYNQRLEGTNIYVTIEATGQTGNGAYGELGTVCHQQMNAREYHSTSVAVSDFFTKGTRVKAKVRLDSDAPGTWVLSDTSFDTGFYGFMLCPEQTAWSTKTPGPSPVLRKTWTDGEVLNASIMNEQSTRQFQALENLPRATSRLGEFSLKGNVQGKVVWKQHFTNADSMKLSDNVLTIPWDGLYLISVFGNARHKDKPESDKNQYIYQISVHDNKAVLYLTQGGNARYGPKTGYSGQTVSDVIFLKQGTKLNIQFWGSYRGTTWYNVGDQSATRRYWNAVVTFLGRG